MLINRHCNIGEVVVCTKFHQGSKPVKCVQGDARCRMNCDLQLVVICVEDRIGLPLLFHVVGVP
jgi:hypothetical protein